MNKILTIAKKEWRNYFNSPTGFVFSGLLIVIANWIYWGDIFLMGVVDIKPMLMTITFLFSIFVPAISMGMIADEKKNGNWEVLMSTPINEFQIVVGKLLGCSLYLIFTLLLTMPTVITLFYLGKPELGVIVSSYFGIMMLGVSYLSVGIFMSSLSGQAIIGFLGSAVFLIINSMMSNEVVLSRLPAAMKSIVEGISLMGRISMFGDGLITFSDMLFLTSFISVFVVLTIVNLKSHDK